MDTYPRPPLTEPFLLTPELFAEQGASLRALARRLLRDRHAAEDVVQDTWLASLVRAPRAPQRIGAWLATVARSIALKRLRGERRRRRHEPLVARCERGDDPAEQMSEERARALRAVADALFELEEPYRTALLLRYFEGLTPR